MAKFRKKPVVIEAEYVDRAFFEKYYGTGHRTGVLFFDYGNWPDEGYALITTLEGQMRANPGDWVITGVAGEKYPIRADIFAATYDAVEA